MVGSPMVCREEQGRGCDERFASDGERETGRVKSECGWAGGGKARTPGENHNRNQKVGYILD